MEYEIKYMGQTVGATKNEYKLGQWISKDGKGAHKHLPEYVDKRGRGLVEVTKTRHGFQIKMLKLSAIGGTIPDAEDVVIADCVTIEAYGMYLSVHSSFVGYLAATLPTLSIGSSMTVGLVGVDPRGYDVPKEYKKKIIAAYPIIGWNGERM